MFTETICIDPVRAKGFIYSKPCDASHNPVATAVQLPCNQHRIIQPCPRVYEETINKAGVFLWCKCVELVFGNLLCVMKSSLPGEALGVVRRGPEVDIPTAFHHILISPTLLQHAGHSISIQTQPAPWLSPILSSLAK